MAKAKKLASGNWNVKVFSHMENGKRKYESFTASTKKEAEYLASQFKFEKSERQEGNITVKEALERYVESRKHILSPSTYREYKSSVERDLKMLHNVRIRALTKEQVQKAIDTEARDHSPKTIFNMYTLFSAAIKMFDARIDISVKLPKKQKQSRYIPTDADIKKLLEYTEGKSIDAPVLLAATGSLKRSEIAALQPEDITDLGVIVNKAMVKDVNRSWVIKAPKTNAGNRFSPLPYSVIERVRKGIPAPNPNMITNQFIDVLRACGLPHFRFHDLRHYYASTLHALNVPDKYIMKNGGWESEDILHNVYQHTLSERAEQENKKVISFFDNLTGEADEFENDSEDATRDAT